MSHRINKQHGPGRQFTADEIAHFAAFREHRAEQRPAQCTYTSPCWVEDGPPAMLGPRCRGCQAEPDARRRWRVPP